MHINCIICSDLLNPADEVFTTTCGHIFHHACLIQWLERSRTCPQCRHKCSDKSIHRVYFNVASGDGIPDDTVTLQSKLDSVKFQLALKDKDMKSRAEEFTKLRMANAQLKTEVKILTGNEKSYISTVATIKDQMSFYKEKSKAVDRLTQEVRKLELRIEDMDRLRTVLDGSRDQVRDMMRNNRDPESLAILVVTLKQELQESDRQRKIINADLRRTQSDLSTIKVLKQNLEAEYLNYEHLREEHKHCEAEKRYLKEKIEKLFRQKISGDAAESSEHTEGNSSIVRIINESPAPYRQLMAKHKDNNDASVESPSIGDKVKIVKASDSPYQAVRMNGISAFKANFSAENNGPKPYSFFKNPLQQRDGSGSSSSSRGEYFYDGMGGHAKEDKFPSGSSSQSHGLKRPKSSSSISKKFKKLAPN